MRMVPYVVNALAIVVEGGNPLGVEGYEDLAGQPVGTEISGFADNLIREINAEQVANGMSQWISRPSIPSVMRLPHWVLVRFALFSDLMRRQPTLPSVVRSM